MYKVFIVDDEDQIRQGLKNIIDWNSLGFEIAGTASNAREAIENISRTNIDLIITDINMPEISGLDMIRHLRNNNFHGYFILVTGYADFEYAMTAIQFGVKSYLLKPMDERILVGELYSIRKELDKNSMLEQSQTVIANLSKEKLLEQFITGLALYQDLIMVPELHQLSVNGSCFQIILINYMASSKDSNKLSDLNSIIVNFVDNHSLVYLYSTNKTFTLLSIDRSKANTLLLNKLQKKILSELDISVQISIGNKVKSFENLPESFKFAEFLFSKQFILGYKGMVSAENLSDIKKVETIDLEELKRKIILSMEYNSLTDINSNLENWMYYLIHQDVSEMEIKIKYIEFFISIVDHFTNQYPDVNSSVYKRQAFIEHAYLHDSILALNSEIKAHLSAISNELEILHPDNIVEKMIYYIDSNYSQNISLTSISNTLHYNRTYLGRKFKNHTGDFFIDYLDNVRVEKSKDLLMKGYKVYQIAEMVGYNNVDYFNNKFKKYTNVSPSQYKKGKK